jgi:hypothetical protein|eukprot:COSAG06_NODE_3233_length_5642_cov_3.121956_4_plen_162_part_00
MTLAMDRNFIVNASAFRFSSLWPALAPLDRFFIIVSVIRVANTFRRSPDISSGLPTETRLQTNNPGSTALRGLPQGEGTQGARASGVEARSVSRKGQSSQFRPEARSQRCRSSAYPPAFRFVPVQPRCRTRTLSRPSALRVASSAVRVPSSVLSDSLTPRR